MAYSRLRRNSAQRKALLRDLVTDLILNGRIETTETKAKARLQALMKRNFMPVVKQHPLFALKRQKMDNMLFKSYLVKLPLNLLAVMEVTLV